MRITLEKPVYGGESLGHQPDAEAKPGKAVFIPLTLPGEIAEVQVVEEKRSFLRAEPVSIVTPSAERIGPRCAHFGACGGCHYQHADERIQLRFKEQILRESLGRAGVAAPQQINLLAGEPWEYRNRVRMALTSEGQLAYRGRRSHDLISIHMCPITAPLLVKAAARAADFIREQPAPLPISELELFTNHDQTQLLVTLFINSHEVIAEPALQVWLAAFHGSLPCEQLGLRVQIQDGNLTSRVAAAYGTESLSYTVSGVAYRVDHGAFFQVNRWLIDRFVALVIDDVETSTLAWDLYAGVGLFARQIVKRGGEVHAVEAAPASLAALRHNLAGTRSQAIASTTLDYLRGNRERRETRPGLILLDPPRAGLGPEVTQLLNAIHAPEMVYVSCDPLTLARDLRALTQERYRIENITLVDMFPQTFHIETIVRLRRA